MFVLVFAITSLKAYADDLLVAKQFINGTTIAIARIDSKKIGLPAELIQKIDSDAQLKKWASPITSALKNLANALNGESVYIAIDIPYSSDVSPVRLYVRNSFNVNSKIVALQLAGFQFG